MSSRSKLIAAVIVLVATGSGIAAYKTNRLGVPFWRGGGAHDWQVEARVSFLATGGKVNARLSLPDLGSARGVSSESGSLGYHFHVDRTPAGPVAVWAAAERDGNQALYYRVRFPEGLRESVEPVAAGTPEDDGLDDGATAGWSGAAAAARDAVVGRLGEAGGDPDSLFVLLFGWMAQEQGAQEFLLLKRQYEREYRTHTMVRMGIDLMRAAGVPARMAYAVRLNEDAGGQAPLPLVEYYDGAAWKVRDPADAAAVPDGRSLFVWHRGGGPLLDIVGGENSRVVFTSTKDRVPLSKLTDLSDSPFLVSTILGLPLAEQAVFRYIVLIPVGALVVVLMRNLVGVPTLGTFMPVLLALALLEMPPATGLMMFGILVGLGLWFRFLLSRLNLLVVPRVAACVVIVCVLMILMGVVGHRLGMAGGTQITLFPMIILAWTIERMSLIWEEEGSRSALTQVGGSVAVAVLAFLIMKNGQLQHWVFYFPELLLVLLAGILLLGRYTGYRLSELFRFREFPG
jgi:hypothetical protein